MLKKEGDDHGEFHVEVKQNVRGQEKTLLAKVHMSIEEVNDGSLVIQLKPESNDAQIRLKEFLSGDGIKEFLKQIFQDTEGLRELRDGACEIKVVVKAKEGTGNNFGNFFVLWKLN